MVGKELPSVKQNQEQGCSHLLFWNWASAKESKVAILSEAKTDWIIAEFAALYTGGISVPLSIKLLPEEVPFRVNHSDTSLFIISENTLGKSDQPMG